MKRDQSGAALLEYVIAFSALAVVILMINRVMTEAATQRTFRAQWVQCRTVPCRPEFAVDIDPNMTREQLREKLADYCNSGAAPISETCK